MSAWCGRGREIHVQEVALRTGFTSPSAFARAFRHRFGQSPTRARGAAGP